jgi:Sulfotransferase family
MTDTMEQPEAQGQLLARQGPLVTACPGDRHSTAPPASGMSNQSGTDGAPDPACFVLCCSRSGSSLVRTLLNNHPDLACPPETEIAHALGSLGHVWSISESIEPRGHATPLPRAAKKALVEAVAAPLREFAARRGKVRWCEKSPSNAEHAEMLLDCFPAAKFICLQRHPMDVVTSALEACQWGFSGYGIEPYIRDNPGNFPAAILTYWLEKTMAVARFETAHPDKCFRMYYESLVQFPEATLRGLCDFLDLPWDPRILTPSFSLPEDLGPGDHKLPHTSEIERSHIGEGSRVPIHYLPPNLLAAVNQQLARLGYPTIGVDWNYVPHPLRRRDYEGCPDLLTEKLRRHLGTLAPEEPITAEVIGVVLQDRAQEDTTLVLDYRSRQVRPPEPDESLPYVIVGTSHDFMDIANGRNVGELLRSGEVRVASLNGHLSALRVYQLVEQLVAALVGREHASLVR